MAIIDITCPACREEVSVPARALLATIELLPSREPLAHLSWVCAPCDDFVIADIDLADLLLLLSVGVLVVDDLFGVNTGWVDKEDAPREDLRRGGWPPFTSADVGALHDLLDTDAWFPFFRRPGDGQ